MASPTQWTWVCENPRRWWRRGKPGMLQSMGSKKDKTEWLNNNKCKSRVITKKLWTSKVRILSLMCIILTYKSPLFSTPPSISMPPVSDISRIRNRWEGMSGSGKVYLTALKVSGVGASSLVRCLNLPHFDLNRWSTLTLFLGDTYMWVHWNPLNGNNKSTLHISLLTREFSILIFYWGHFTLMGSLLG